MPAPALRILCVDDHAMLLELLAAVFSRAGHHVAVAADGLAARERLAGASFDLVITDHQMPRLGGLALVEWLRVTRFTGRIIVHSSAISPPDLARYQTLGVDAIVGKGMTPTSWLDLLARLPVPSATPTVTDP